ncbi:DUF421 domain-containing protein [Salsipaludibacter albus]|uniref:DUF421 domain-containing protein n=1 Tax=Salsipaludibacter albus TaxID=2849650 RepID=UPI001EE3A479|nr:YetF domain-containing protein [Salsipaludibacter albus]MBY5161381.1 DUF421 domain-containing protein [Salsipaludibacter albus]
MHPTGWLTLALDWGEAGLTVVTVVGLYALTILASRLLGQRQFSSLSSYDLAFTFALGAIIGRGVLVVTNLSGAALALVTMFVLHAGLGWLHHHVEAVHRFTQNRPILVVADGEVLSAGLRRARMSRTELRQCLRSHGVGSLDEVRAAILERSGEVSVVPVASRLDHALLTEVVGARELAPSE